MTNFSLIVAVDQNMGIGKNGTLPWYLPEDMKYFSKTTKHTDVPGLQNAVIMGRRTWESIPAKFKPLPERINVVLSSNPDLELPDDVLHFGSLDEALTALSTSPKIDEIFVIGGAKLYEEAVLHPELERIYLTRIEEIFDCDTFFPDQIPEDFEIVSSTEIMESDGLEYSFVVLERDVDHSENEYVEFE
jgi:dihydrofolate reductase